MIRPKATRPCGRKPRLRWMRTPGDSMGIVPRWARALVIPVRATDHPLPHPHSSRCLTRRLVFRGKKMTNVLYPRPIPTQALPLVMDISAENGDSADEARVQVSPPPYCPDSVHPETWMVGACGKSYPPSTGWDCRTVF